MFKSKITLVFLMVVLSIFLISSITSAVEFDFWTPFTGPDGDVIDAMVKDYNQTAGPEEDIKVNLQVVPWGDYYTKLTVSMTSRTAPELAICHSHRIAGYVKEGALQEIDPNILKDLGIVGEDYVTELWEAGTVEGKRYAVPIDAFPRHIYYNKILFEKAGLDPESPPTNLEEMIEYSQKINDLGDDIYGMWFGLEGNHTYRDFLAYYYQHQDKLLNDDNTALNPNFAETAKKVLQIRKDFLNKYQVAPTENVEYTALMSQGKLGIAVSQITELQALLQGESENFEVGAAPMPTYGDQKATFALGHNFILPRGQGQSGEKMEAISHFINWFGENTIQWAAGGKVPANIKIMDTEEFKELEVPSIVAQQVDYMRTPPLVAEMPRITSVIQENVEKVYADKISIDKAVENMINDIEPLLSE